jgi:hypothetical protein
VNGAGTKGAPDAPFIRRVGEAARKADAFDYVSLRAYAIERAQAASGGLWTDYNLHDPGVTLLEAVCFALTELIYKADLDIVDHLCEADGRIEFARQALFEPHDVFPCRATTIGDLRRVLLDQVEALQDVFFQSTPDGLYHARILPSDDAAQDLDALKAAVRRAYRGERLLGEDLDDAIECVGSKTYALCFTATLKGARAAEDVLAEIYDVCASAFSPTPRFQSFETLRSSGWPLERFFTGPRTRSGVLADAAAGSTGLGSPGRISLSDLRRRVRAVEGVAEVERLTLTDDAGETVERVLEWRPTVEWARLRTPASEPGTDFLAGVDLNRQGARVVVEPGELAARYSDRRAGRGRRPAPLAPAEAQPSRGAPRAPLSPYSVRHHFPPLYRLGDAGVPDGPDRGASARERVRIEQLRAYLALFDQLLANGAAQLDHARDLFSPAPDAQYDRSYWFDVIDDAVTPGIEKLYGGKSPDEVGRIAFDPYDDAADRRSRALDHALAIYGETLDDASIRQFLDYLDAPERTRFLIEIKAAFLRQVVVLGRDRAGGIDYGEPVWEGEAHTPGVQRRIALLIGFRQPRARSLISAPFDTDGPAGGGEGPPGADTAIRPTRVRPGPEGARPLRWPEHGAPADDRDAPRLQLGRRSAAVEALFRLGVHRRRYGWRPDDAGVRLMLGPDERGAWWDLGGFEDEARAARAAVWLRRRLLELSEACEGLHIVEHNLLRARRPSGDAPPGLGATFVLPDWTARTSRADFQRFVEQTVRAQAPAHVATDCLWLDRKGMAVFEEAFGVWMERLRAHAAEPGPPEALDDAAAELCRLLPAFAAATATGAD